MSPPRSTKRRSMPVLKSAPGTLTVMLCGDPVSGAGPSSSGCMRSAAGVALTATAPGASPGDVCTVAAGEAGVAPIVNRVSARAAVDGAGALVSAAAAAGEPFKPVWSPGWDKDCADVP